MRAVWVIDGKGRIIFDSDVGNLGVDLSSRDYFRHHQASRETGFYIGGPVKSLSTGTWFVSASRPVRAPDGTLSAVVVAALDHERFGRFWRVPVDDDVLSVDLMRADATVLLRSSPPDEGTPRASDGRAKSLGAPVIQSEAGLYHQPAGLFGTDLRIHSFGPVPDFPALKLGIGFPLGKPLTGWLHSAIFGLAAFLIATALTIIAAMLLTRQFRQRLTSQKLSAALARYPLNNKNPVLTVSREGSFQFVNAAANQLIESVLDADMRAAMKAKLLEMANSDAPGVSEFMIGGRVFSASHLPYGAEACDIYLTDISALRQGEDMLQLFLELPFLGLALTSPESKTWLYVNDRLCEMLGYSRSELLSKTWAELTHPDDLQADVAEFDRVMRAESDGYTMDKRYLHRDGSVIHAAIDVKALRSPDGTVTQFMATVQDITERKLHLMALRRQRDLYAALSDTNHAITECTTRDLLFPRVCKAAVERAGFLFAWIGMLDPVDRSTLRCEARHGDDQGYIDTADVALDPGSPHGRGPGGRALLQGTHQIVNDIASDPAMAIWQAQAERVGARAVGSFPIRRGAEVVGVFNVYAEQCGTFDAEAVGLLDEMSSDISFALDNFDREDRRVAALAELAESESRFRRAVEQAPFPLMLHAEDGSVISISRSWIELSGYTIDDMPTTRHWTKLAYGADRRLVEEEIESLYGLSGRRDEGEYAVRCKDGSTRIWDFSSVGLGPRIDGKRLVISMAADVTQRNRAVQKLSEANDLYRTLVDHSLIGIFMVDETAVQFANPRAAEIFGYAPSELVGLPLPQLIAPASLDAVRLEVSRILGGAASAGFEFMARQRQDAEVLVGAQGARTLKDGRPVVLGVMQDITEKKQADQRIAQYHEQLRTALMSTVGLAAALGDLRDPYTSGHARRVAEIASAIGTELGQPAHFIDGLRVAGTLHDIGKIQVPSELLSKPGRLTANEFALIKEHAQAGYEVLKMVDFPWPVALVAQQHHERMDGSGYPKGLKGDAITLEARIMAVADVVEAMASHRPYRAGLGIDKALAEIVRGRGTAYDASVVDACLRLFREKEYKIPP